MNRPLMVLRGVLLLSVVMLSIVLTPFCASADAGPEEQEEKLRDLRQAAAEKRMEESRERVEEAFGADEKSKFTPHQLNYGVLGKDDALMQISFKYRLGRDWNWYLAFTSVIKWDVWEESSPYSDINFKPEVFYRFTPAIENLVSVDAGYWHESNGQGGEESRSWDQLFVRFNTLFDINNLALAWETHLYGDLNTGDFNEDIGDYLGWWDTAIYLLNILPFDTFNMDLEFYLWSGDNGVPFDRGQYRTGVVFKWENAVFQPSLYLQYFNGYGEVMAEYDERSEAWRVGIAFLY
jgi:outer membrane phospholipase A